MDFGKPCSPAVITCVVSVNTAIYYLCCSEERPVSGDLLKVEQCTFRTVDIERGWLSGGLPDAI